MWFMDFDLVLSRKLQFLWKAVKWYELCKTLEFKWFGLWEFDVYTTTLICDLCIYLVEASQRVWVVLSDKLEMNETRQLVVICNFLELA